jgi:CHAT domain-containing protein
VGLARGFLLANASATVVSLWQVDDGSTAALMECMYTHLVQGCSVTQSLRRAMLLLACRPHPLQAEPHDFSATSTSRGADVADGLEEEWTRPMHWAGFLVVGADTYLTTTRPA